MRCYKHRLTNTDLFIMIGNTPEWTHTHVNGASSQEAYVPLYCRQVLCGEITLVHVEEWVYTNLLIEISEQEARSLDLAQIERIEPIERGEETPQFTERTKTYSVLKDPD
jgi:hypothetical protein